jgi:hypothetical protein
LVLNDHVLKHSGVVAGWITGKLSDFAGLIVAPVVLAAFVGARRPSARIGCLAIVIAGFVAVKLSASAAHLLESAMGGLGVRSRIWSDPTDLVALGVLPLSVRVLLGARRSSACEARARERHRFGVREFVSLGLGAAACLATSVLVDRVETSIFLVNTTRESLPVAVYRVALPLDCAAVSADSARFLTADQFRFERCWQAPPFESVPLDQDWRAIDEPPDASPEAGTTRFCDAVLVRTPRMSDTVVFWNQVAKVEVDRTSNTPVGDQRHTAYVEQFGNRLLLSSPELAQVWLAGFTLPAADCGASP